MQPGGSAALGVDERLECGFVVQLARVRQDKHGRGMRGVFLPDLPRYQSRSQRFDRAVLDAYEPIAARFEQQLASLDIAVDIAPRMRLDAGYHQWPDDVVADGQVPLGRLVPAGVDHRGMPTRPRIIIFRRPLELRCPDRVALAELLDMIFVRLVAYYLNVSPEVVDPTFRW